MADVVLPCLFWISELAYLHTVRTDIYSMSSKGLMIELKAEYEQVWTLIVFHIMTSIQ